MSLVIEGLSRFSYTRTLLERISLELGSGEMLAVLGPAGSGRASLLRALAGLDPVDAGVVRLDGQDITHLPPRRRPIAYLYQHDPLFSHPTAAEAVLSALPEGGRGDPQAAEALLALVGLGGRGAAMPATLAQAQRHRLALARALALRPRLLLVGEAFGTQLPARRVARSWLRDLTQAVGLTTVLVAQDAHEATAIADRMAVLRDGRLEQVGPPQSVRRWPATPFVAEFLGIATPVAASTMQALDLAPGTLAAIAPQQLEVVEAGVGTPARVLTSTAFGARLTVELQLLADGSRLAAEIPSIGMATLLPPGTVVGVRLRRGSSGFGHA